jgi:predicted Fe-Mo cluster-binding NifX family protein
MKIAVTSQNRREITEHAGRCRNFWVFDVEDGRVASRSLLELPRGDSFHDSSPHAHGADHGLDPDHEGGCSCGGGCDCG